MKVAVEELESLLGPEDSEVDFTRILEETRNKQGRAIVSRARWDEHQRKLGTQKEESRRMAQEVEELEENRGDMSYEGSPAKAASECQKKKDAANPVRKSSAVSEAARKEDDCRNGKLLGKVRR